MLLCSNTLPCLPGKRTTWPVEEARRPQHSGLAAGPGLSLGSREATSIWQQVLVGLQAGQTALLQGNGLGRVFALLRAALACEVLALDVPEAVAVVKSAEQGEKRSEDVRVGPPHLLATH